MTNIPHIHREKIAISCIYSGMKTFYSITDCSRLLGVEEHRIAYAHRANKLPEPKIRFAGKRVYSRRDLRRLADYFGVEIPESEMTKEK
jgi:hypothetical protein